MTVQEWRAKGQFTTYREQEIFYLDEGKGPAVLLVHGFPTSSMDWWQIWPTLTANYRILALDMIGFGFSAKPKNYTYSIFDQADLQQAFLAERGINEVHILCHDYGDTVVQELLARFNEISAAETAERPLRLKSVCFQNGGLFPGVHKPLLVQHLLMSPIGALVGKLLNRKKLGRNFKKIFGPNTQPTEAELDDFWELIETNDGKAISHKLIQYMREREQNETRWVGALQQTSVPLRLIDGAYDPISGQHMADHYRKVIPNPDIVILPQIGHFPLIEAPEAVVGHYLAFLKQQHL